METSSDLLDRSTGEAHSDAYEAQRQRLERRVFEAAAVLNAVLILAVIAFGYLLGIVLQYR